MSKSPNILIVNCDQLSAQALRAWAGSFGQTPNMDRILRRGVRFENAYTNCPLCQPARASFWTGLYPHQTGVLSNGLEFPVEDIPETVPTLGSLFSEAGYTTVHFGKMHDAGSLRGFECSPLESAEIDDAHPAWPLNYDSFQDRFTREKVVEFLEDYLQAAPYLAVADLQNPHNICGWIGEFQADAELISPETPLPPLPENLYRPAGEFEKLPLPIQYICCAHNRQAQMAEWDENRVRHYLAAYYHYIERVDAEIGLILDTLGARDDAEETLIVFMADHGDSMCGRWMATKHTSFYDETTHVPLAFSGPGVMGEDRVTGGFVSLLDLLPTLCDYAGLEAPAGLFGRSLLPWLTEQREDSPHDYIISQWHTEWGFTIEPGRMVRSERYKYTHYLEGDGEELYDLQNDPGEVRNLAGEPAMTDVLAEHRAILEQYIEQTDDPYFSMEWKADDAWRSHAPGYCNHRGPTAPQYAQ